MAATVGAHRAARQRGRKGERGVERKGQREGRRVFHMGMSTLSPSDNYNRTVSVSVTLPSVSPAPWPSPPPPPVSYSSSSYPPWVCCPLQDVHLWRTTWHQQVCYWCFLLLCGNEQGKMIWHFLLLDILHAVGQSHAEHQWIINKCDLGFVCSVLLTLVIKSYVRISCRILRLLRYMWKVHRWANAPLSWFGLSNRLLINSARVNKWFGLLCQSPGTGTSSGMFCQLIQLSRNHLK